MKTAIDKHARVNSIKALAFKQIEETEQDTLGKILWKPERLLAAKAKLKPQDFRYKKHQVIFQAMLEMEEQGIPLDVYNLWCFLKEKNELDIAGRSMYLTYLMEVTKGENDFRS